MKNRNLHQAKRAKKDEFYTQLADIERELRHYTEHFRGKTVYCNCDDPRVSNFFRYFALNFEKLGLKKLITTCYKNADGDEFSRGASEQAVCLDYTGDKNGNKIPDLDEIGIRPLEGDGDFRSAESIALLQEADIVVTNPPFSLFREYVAQLVEYDKKFIIVGSLQAVKYREIFPLIQDGKLWLGPSRRGGECWFVVPDKYAAHSGNCRVGEDGKTYIGIGIRWFTNLDFPKRHEDIILFRKYAPEVYPKYDNYDAIEVSRTKDIPADYDGVMGVPISFLNNYNPDQFEIVGKLSDGKVGGVAKYERFLISRRGVRSGFAH